MTSGSSNSSRAKRCSFERARSPHASGDDECSRVNSSPRRRARADCEPERSTAKPFSWTRPAPGTASHTSRPQAYRQSMRSCGVSMASQPLARPDSGRCDGRCSAASTPRWAALMRRAASFDTMRVGATWACPSAAPMIRLSALSGSRPCSIRRCRWMPLTSMRKVPPRGSSVSGTASTNEPPAAVRNSSMVRRAGSRRAADVVEASLQAVEFLDDRERHDDVAAVIAAQRRRIGHEHRRVEHDARPRIGTGSDDSIARFIRLVHPPCCWLVRRFRG